ncbi:MAG: glyoxalase [Pseudohongiella sp.]|nr:MAG: glyoxalase [Pseudohongiella sp.]
MQILEHIHLSVASIAVTERFLKLALPEYSRRGGGMDPEYGAWLHIGSESNYIALTEVKEIDPIEGLRHIGLVVSDLDALMNRLQAAGIEPSDDSAVNGHAHRRRVYYCDDNGVHWEFVEYLTEDPSLRNDYSH